MKFKSVVIAIATVIASASTADAAVATGCLCRAPDGKSFVEKLFRHHKWACDFQYGYAKGSLASRLKRPTTETCNHAEIIQFKTYICVSNGCSYAFTEASTDGSKALKEIKPMVGQRRP